MLITPESHLFALYVVCLSYILSLLGDSTLIHLCGAIHWQGQALPLETQASMASNHVVIYILYIPDFRLYNYDCAFPESISSIRCCSLVNSWVFWS